MSIEIDILNGDAAWPQAKPLMDAVWPRDVLEKLPWRHVKWAHADLRVLIDAPDGNGLACHVGIYFRTVTWNGQKVHIGGIGGVSTRNDCRRRGYASLALDAAVQTMRANEAAKFAILFCDRTITHSMKRAAGSAFPARSGASSPKGGSVSRQ
jgi:aminoglycoside 2'-N-acetyltransferase I